MKDKIKIKTEELQIFMVPVDNPEEKKKINLSPKSKRKPKYKWKTD